MWKRSDQLSDNFWAFRWLVRFRVTGFGCCNVDLSNQHLPSSFADLLQKYLNCFRYFGYGPKLKNNTGNFDLIKPSVGPRMTSGIPCIYMDKNSDITKPHYRNLIANIFWQSLGPSFYRSCTVMADLRSVGLCVICYLLFRKHILSSRVACRPKRRLTFMTFSLKVWSNDTYLTDNKWDIS